MNAQENVNEQEEILSVLLGHAELHARLADLRAALSAYLEAGGQAPDWTEVPLARRYYRPKGTARRA